MTDPPVQRVSKGNPNPHHNPHDPMPWLIVYEGNHAELVDFAARLVIKAWDTAATAQQDIPDHVGRLHAAFHLLREVCVQDVPEEYDPRQYIADQHWIYAKTMPQFPHSYVMLRHSTDWREHLLFLRWIRVWGQRVYIKRFSRTYDQVVVDDFTYWALGPNDTIINRRHKDVPQP